MKIQIDFRQFSELEPKLQVKFMEWYKQRYEFDEGEGITINQLMDYINSSADEYTRSKIDLLSSEDFDSFIDNDYFFNGGFVDNLWNIVCKMLRGEFEEERKQEIKNMQSLIESEQRKLENIKKVVQEIFKDQNGIYVKDEQIKMPLYKLLPELLNDEWHGTLTTNGLLKIQIKTETGTQKFSIADKSYVQKKQDHLKSLVQNLQNIK